MDTSTTHKLYTAALALAVFTIFYNLAEGLISVGFGIQDETLTLFGFGVDSFIELLSGTGILAMILRIRANPGAPKSPFEQTALRVTGWSFYLLAAGLAATAALNVITGHRPESTLPGVIIAVLSILVMWWLVWRKTTIGRALNSAPILADAGCTRVCIYMSLVLLAASFVYELTGFGFVDSLGALALTWLSIREGREAFEKARSLEDVCACAD